MITKKYSLLLIIGMALFFSCKKDKNEPLAPEPLPLVEESDFTLQVSDVNYAIGTTWTYSLSTENKTTYINNAVPPYSQYSNSTYTVKVMYDSLMPNNVTGKVLQTFIEGLAGNATIKELQYVDPLTNMWHQLQFGSINNSSITPSGITIKLPLTTTSNWKNPYYQSQASTIDSCYATGFENLNIVPGYLKCIIWKNKNTETPQNTYWYNKNKVRTKIQSKKITFPDPNTYVIETSTTTLTKYN